MNIKKKVLTKPKPFGQTENGLVFGRLACTSSKTEIANKTQWKNPLLSIFYFRLWPKNKKTKVLKRNP